MANELAFCSFDQLEEFTKSCQDHNEEEYHDQEEVLSFGESYWDYLSDLIQDYILDLAAKALHKEKIKKVCKAIIDYDGMTMAVYIWSPTNWSPFYKNLPPSNSPDLMKTRFCAECFRIISPDIILACHRCLPVAFEEEEEEEEKSLCFFFMNMKNYFIINKNLQQHILNYCRHRSMKFHLCWCFRYVVVGILVSMYLRIMRCGPLVIIFSKIL